MGQSARAAGYRALETFYKALGQRAELQSVALGDLAQRLAALSTLAASPVLDDAKVHGLQRDLVHVFTGLADNAQAFMASLARAIDLQRTDATLIIA